MKEVYTAKYKELRDLCKVIYEAESRNYIQVYELNNNKYLYFCLFMISDFFENKGAPVLSYAISSIEPKDFLFWDLINNVLTMKDKGKKVIDNEVVFLIAKVEKLPQFLEVLLSEL